MVSANYAVRTLPKRSSGKGVWEKGGYKINKGKKRKTETEFGKTFNRTVVSILVFLQARHSARIQSTGAETIFYGLEPILVISTAF